MNKLLLNAYENLLKEVVVECGKMYSFDAEEALVRLGVGVGQCVGQGVGVVGGMLEDKKKGRPKKSKKVLEVESVDLFAELIAAANPVVVDPVVVDPVVVDPVVENKVVVDPVVVVETDKKVEKKKAPKKSK